MLALERPERLLVVAFLLLLFGCVAPFLMVLDVVESTMFLNLLSFAASTLGLLLGFIGTALLRVKTKARAKREFGAEEDEAR